MTRALLFLLVRSARGRTVQALRRLREPRYLIGFLIGAGWAAFWLSSLFGRSPVGFDFSGDVQFGLPAEAVESLAGPLGKALQLSIALLLAGGVTVWWLVPFGRNALQFSESELHLLLPAPLLRRRLIQYGVLRSQPGVLFGVAIVTFFSRPREIGAALTTFTAVWIFMSIWDLHSKGRGLWLALLAEMPRGAAWRRRILVWAALLILWVLLIAGLNAVFVEVLATPATPTELSGDVLDNLVEMASVHADNAWSGPLGWALTPFLWLIAPVFAGIGATNPIQLLATWAIPLLLLLAHNEWVVRGQARFEEAALEQARRRGRDADPAARLWRRSQRRRQWQPFPLTPRSRPEMVVVWKNVMLVQRLPFKTLFAAGVALIVLLIATALTGLLPARWVGVLQIGGAALMIFPPVFPTRTLRNDLRTDLLKLEMIRPWPLAGARMFLAQVAAPFVLIAMRVGFGALLLVSVDTALELGLINFAGGAGLAESSGLWEAAGKAELATGLGVSSLLLTPLVVLGVLPLSLTVALLSIGLENLAALTFPGWVPLGMKKQAASQFGHNLLVFMAISMALFFGLAPGVLVIGATLATQVWLWGIPLSAWELPVLGIAGAMPVLAIVVALAGVGGSLWDRLDPSEEILADSI